MRTNHISSRCGVLSVYADPRCDTRVYIGVMLDCYDSGRGCFIIAVVQFAAVANHNIIVARGVQCRKHGFVVLNSFILPEGVFSHLKPKRNVNDFKLFAFL